MAKKYDTLLYFCGKQDAPHWISATLMLTWFSAAAIFHKDHFALTFFMCMDCIRLGMLNAKE